MANQVFVGIDPGKSGGVSLIKIVEGEISAESYPMEAVELPRLMADLIEDERTYAVIACVEKVGARPGQGVTSMFNFGQGFGYIQGVLDANFIPYQLIPPQKWKKEFSLGADKEDSIKACKRLFPHVSLRRTPKCAKDHDGMAESLLIAEYARRKFKAEV